MHNHSFRRAAIIATVCGVLAFGIGGQSVCADDTDAGDEAARQQIVADLNSFLSAVGQPALGSFSDYNALDYKREEGKSSHVYGPNGIPDWAEFAMIHALVQDPSVDFTAYSGVGGEFVKRAYEENLVQATTELPGKDAAIQRTVAYYMTLGDVGSATFAKDMVRMAWDITLTERGYKTSSSRHLMPYGNADNDGQFNIEEWEQSGRHVEGYLERVFDGVGESLLDPKAEAFVENCGQCKKTKIDYLEGPPEINEEVGHFRVLLMTDGKRVKSGTEVALGRWMEISVDIDPDDVPPGEKTMKGLGYQFDHWYAPGNLLNGERSQRARFMLMPPPQGDTLIIGMGF